MDTNRSEWPRLTDTNDADPEQWTDAPPNAPIIAQYKLLRTQPGKPQAWVVLSDRFVGTATHFFNRRTVKHTAENCIPCANGNAARWFGFLGVYNPTTGQIAIHEFPKDTVSSVLAKYAHMLPLRGRMIRVERVPNRANGIVHATVVTIHQPLEHLPPEMKITDVLQRMWDRNCRGMNESERSV